MREEDKDRGRGRLTKGKWFGVVRSRPFSGLEDERLADLELLLLCGRAECRSVYVGGAPPRQGPSSRLLLPCSSSPSSMTEEPFPPSPPV